MAKSGYRKDVINRLGEVGGNIYDLVAAFNDSRLVTYLTAAACNYALPPDVDFRRRSAMRIGALASRGIVDNRFEEEVSTALDRGLQPSQIVEVMFHTIPYAGIPRPLNCIIATKEIFRKRGLLPVNLKEPDWPGESRSQIGREKMETMHPEAAPTLERNLADIAPPLFDYITRTAFADVYTRPDLTDHQHQLITLIALASLGNTENHFQTHTTAAFHLNPRLTPKDITGALVDTLGIVEPELVLKAIHATQQIAKDQNVGLTEKSLGWTLSRDNA